MKTFKHIYILISTIFLYLLTSCSHNSLDIKEVDHELYDGRIVTVLLDPNHNQVRMNFETIDEYYLLSESRIDSKFIRLNASMYSSLIHYYDPIEISIMDMDGIVVLNNEKYKATKEAFLKEVNDKWEIQIYHGINGDISLLETELIHANMHNLNSLKDYDFKDPSSLEIYNNYQNNMKKISEFQALDEGFFYFRPSNDPNQYYELKYRNTPSGPIYTAYMRWYCWNETYRSGTNARARGGTITQVNRLHDGFGWSSLQNNTIPIGGYHENGSVDTSTPWTSVTVITYNSNGSIKQSRTSEATSWRVSREGVHRNNNTGAESFHSAETRYNNDNSRSRIMSSFYVQ